MNIRQWVDSIFMSDKEWKRKHCSNLYNYLFEMSDKERHEAFEKYQQFKIHFWNSGDPDGTMECPLKDEVGCFCKHRFPHKENEYCKHPDGKCEHGVSECIPAPKPFKKVPVTNVNGIAMFTVKENLT